jgi:hypothetical protein
LDTRWAVRNFEVTDRIASNVATRGVVVGETVGFVSSIKSDFRSVTEENANDIIQKLRHLAREARAISSEMSRALNA